MSGNERETRPRYTRYLSSATPLAECCTHAGTSLPACTSHTRIHDSTPLFRSSGEGYRNTEPQYSPCFKMYSTALKLTGGVLLISQDTNFIIRLVTRKLQRMCKRSSHQFPSQVCRFGFGFGGCSRYLHIEACS